MKPRELVSDDEPSLREMLGILLRRAGYETTLAASQREALQRIAEEEPFDAVITDLLMPDGSGMDVLRAARERDESTQVLMITAHATTEQAVEAMRLGAYDYVQKPFNNDELLAALEKALEKRALVTENRVLRGEALGESGRYGLVGRSLAMQRLRALIEKVAATPSSVLITGESGTGKEVVARAIHRLSPRADGPFVVVNCGALPESLMESELFGHEKGAFTGATSAKPGLFRAAHGGTLFLDEIGELPLPLQVKLLRTLQEKAVRPVGGEKELPVDVRVLAATNKNLEEEVREGRFRQDLFYRLNVIRVEMPPLRARREDIPLLAQHFLEKHAALVGERRTLSPAALRRLLELDFPGNVRELENLIERGATLASGEVIEPADLGFFDEPTPPAPAGPTEPTELPPGFDLDAHLAREEERYLRLALEQAGGVRTRAAELLGMSFRQFRYRLAKYEPDVGD
jgi:two-component system response regulator PilR (NtrC family)